MPDTARGSNPGDTIIAIPRRTELKAISHDLVPDSVGGPARQTQFKVRLANTEGRRSRTSYLISRRYAWRGYSVSQVSDSPANRITLAAFRDEHPIATLTVGVDSASGLAVEVLYPQEVQTLRTAGVTLCEFTKLAVESVVRSRAVLAAIFHIAYIYGHRIRGCSDLLIEVNPRHVRFYQSMLGFTLWGEERMDARVSAPAVLLRLELAYAEAEIAQYGGRGELADHVRSLYPLFFSAQEEHGIEGRLRKME